MKIEVSEGIRIGAPGIDQAQSAAAGEAIRLRLLVRAALDQGDWSQVALLNRVADEAYMRLVPEEARIYLDWCRDDMQPFIARRGDA